MFLIGGDITPLPVFGSLQYDTVFNDDILSKLQHGTLLIEMSNVGPDAEHATAEKIEKLGKGLQIVDVGVCGGTLMDAESGTLTLAVGGSEVAFHRAEPLLELMGTKVIHCGPIGYGQIARLCNNVSLAVNNVALSEALLLGTRLGIDPHMLSNIINTSSGRSRSSQVNNPWPGIVPDAPSSRDYNQGYPTGLLTRDLDMALDLAKRTYRRTLFNSSVF